MLYVKVYIGYIYGKGLFHAYGNSIENGVVFFMDKNLSSLIKDVVRASKESQNNIKIKVKVCKYSFII